MYVSYLSAVQRLVTRVTVVEQEHVNKGDEEAGSVLRHVHVVRDPLIENQNDKVAKKTAHENNLGNESKVDIQRLVEVPAKNHICFVTNTTKGKTWRNLSRDENLTGG